MTSFKIVFLFLPILFTNCFLGMAGASYKEPEGKNSCENLLLFGLLNPATLPSAFLYKSLNNDILCKIYMINVLSAPASTGTGTGTSTGISAAPATVTTFAGSGTYGTSDGTGTSASFASPRGITGDSAGNLYVTDYLGNKIRKITPSGTVTTFAGSGTTGGTDANGTSAAFNHPFGIAADSSGNLYVGDYSNHKIRKITSGATVTTLAGSGFTGSTDASGASASFYFPAGTAVDGSGNVFVADTANNKIRKITSAGSVSTFAGTGSLGSTDGSFASFAVPNGVAVNSSGTVYAADTVNHIIRKITLSGTTSLFAGTPNFSGNRDGTGTDATFSSPKGIALDSAGNIYVADTGNHSIRKITSAGVVTTIAGSGFSGSSDGTGTSASFFDPTGIYVDSSGVIYVADTVNNKIRKIVQ